MPFDSVDVGLVIAFVLTGSFVYSNYVTWEENFGVSRLPRTANGCPSNGAPPKLRSSEEFKHITIDRASKHQETFAGIEEYVPDEVKEGKISYDRSDDKEASESARLIDSEGVTYGNAEDEETRSPCLNMDHQYLSFGQYMWSQLAVGPNALALWLGGVAKLVYRDFLYRRGRLTPKKLDADDLAAKLVLESAISIHYQGKKTDENGDLIATFAFPDFPMVMKDGSFHVADLFQVNVDLNKKKMVSSFLDDKELNASETSILLFYYTISAFHVKLHSYANWGLNLGAEQKKKNPIPFRSAMVTVIYNYFGYTSFATFFPFWKMIGVLSKNFEEGWIGSINHGVGWNSTCHPDIYDLMPYSEFINFFCKLKPFFMNEFSKVKDKYFPNCYGDALFYGSIMHSVDHCRMDWNIEDPLWLDADHPEFGLMAEIGRIVKVGFSI
ncbi:hypothetical protein CTEN210_03642 [Chaetoceros tenuissimus]|uniref:Uncharacterized protein n=1 Tax=Chaetoceros tenuissimus TaxID=426638 RepID=A0AAD3CJF1_9STRA|nr:hypothetical protein CTEN210_03642 [Chaetoceros tenuissimus]